MGRVRDVAIIAGPNTCGKTTVLDALAFGLSYITGFSYSRPGFILTPSAIVRRGALQARVTTCIRFSQEEIETARRLYSLAEENDIAKGIPDVEEVTITWKYPDWDRQKYPSGYIHCEPREAWHIFKGRVRLAQLLPTGRVDWDWFNKVGGVFAFDQQRTGMGKIIPRDIWAIISGSGSGDTTSEERRTSDPRVILLGLAVRSQFPPSNEHQLDQYKLIQKRYEEICRPHRILRVERDELDQMEIVFSDGNYEYRYDGLSSGEQMLLLFLIRMVTDHVHQSIVFVDEIELHQHPLWQRKLLYLLPRIGVNNQIIATTHSPYLRDVLSRDAIIDLGELGDTGEAEA
jgi:hypothetical protein